MTTVTTGTCRACGAAVFGKRFCEHCGASQEAGDSMAITPASTLLKLRIVTVAGALLVSVVPSIATTIAYAVNDYSQLGPRVVVVLLVLATTAAAIFAARLDRAVGTARTWAIVLISVVGGLAAVSSGFFSVAASLIWVFPIALFLSWGLSARFRGLGYWGLAIGLGVAILQSLVGGFFLSSLYSSGGVAGYEAVTVILEAIVIGAGVGSAIWLERIHARRPVRERALPMQYAPGGAGAPTPGYPGMANYGERTNGLAIATLILGIVGGTIVTIILGHIALSQIRRTGEQGHGMAVAGLILGYVWTGAVIILLIVYVSIWAATLQALSHPYGTY